MGQRPVVARVRLRPAARGVRLFVRVAVFQGVTEPGKPQTNWETTLKTLQQADDGGADVLCMPEAFLQGYFQDATVAATHSLDLESTGFDQMVVDTNGYRPMLLLGLNEKRGSQLYNTVVVLQSGRYLGKYSKACTILRYHTPGRDFPVFYCKDVCFGIIICADSSYVEPSRILAVKGAKVIFAPHHNYIRFEDVGRHAAHVRANLAARAVDNDVYVARSNVIWRGRNPCFDYDGLGVGDSLVLNRLGKPIAEAGLFTSTLLFTEIPDQDLRTSHQRLMQAELAEILARETHKAYADENDSRSTA